MRYRVKPESLTLWDLLTRKPRRRAQKKEPTRAQPRPLSTNSRPSPARARAQERYEQVTKDMLRAHHVRVRKWRTHMSGVAWEVRYADGAVARLIESPKPKGPVSAAIFLHEIGHHAIGLGVYRPRCLEEYHAWMWSLARMREFELNITPRVEARVRESLEYAVWKAKRRGLKRVPEELVEFLSSRE